MVSNTLVNQWSLEGKRIVITGGSGFLGTSMASEFACAGARVTVIARSKQVSRVDCEHKIWDGRSTSKTARRYRSSSTIVVR
ncbi:NAD-binding protein [Pirellulaceae bacterium SH501]